MPNVEIRKCITLILLVRKINRRTSCDAIFFDLIKKRSPAHPQELGRLRLVPTVLFQGFKNGFPLHSLLPLFDSSGRPVSVAPGLGRGGVEGKSQTLIG